METMKAFTIVGKWWLPNNPDNQVSGILKYNPYDRSSLELIGAFNEDENNDFPIIHSVINGISKDGNRITLYECYEYDRLLSPFASSQFYISYIFSKHHFLKEDDILFESVSYNFLQFEDWLGISGIKLPKAGFSIFYDFQDEITININGLIIEFIIKASRTREIFNVIELKEYAYIKVIPENPKRLEYYFNNIMYKITSLLNLVYSTATFPIRIIANNENCYSELNNKKILNDIDIHTRILSIRIPPKEMEMIIPYLSYNDLSAKLDFYIKKWFEIADTYKQILNLYISNMNQQTYFTDERFLNMARAIDRYYQEKVGDSTNKFKETIVYAAKLANEIEIIINDVDEFADIVKKSRNYYSHYSKKIEEKQAVGKDLKLLELKLQLILEIILSREMGLEKHEIRENMYKNRTNMMINKIK